MLRSSAADEQPNVTAGSPLSRQAEALTRRGRLWSLCGQQAGWSPVVTARSMLPSQLGDLRASGEKISMGASSSTSSCRQS